MTSTTTTTATSTTYTTTPKPRLGLSRPARTGRGLSGIATASTPNLNQLYSSQAQSQSQQPPSLSSRLVPPALSRKASYAALTQNSLATIPDDTEAYALHSVLNTTDNDTMPLTINPGTMTTGDEITIGDIVDVPGNMTGTVRFIGSVDGRKGIFAGVELHREFASRGKNSGDVDG